MNNLNQEKQPLLNTPSVVIPEELQYSPTPNPNHTVVQIQQPHYNNYSQTYRHEGLDQQHVKPVLILFLLGIIFPPLFLIAFRYRTSRNPTAKRLAYVSLIMFIINMMVIGVIVGLTL